MRASERNGTPIWRTFELQLQAAANLSRCVVFVKQSDRKRNPALCALPHRRSRREVDNPSRVRKLFLPGHDWRIQTLDNNPFSESLFLPGNAVHVPMLALVGRVSTEIV